MLDNEPTGGVDQGQSPAAETMTAEQTPARPRRTRKKAAEPAGEPPTEAAEASEAKPAKKAAKRAPRKAAKKAAPAAEAAISDTAAEPTAEEPAETPQAKPAKKAAKRAPRKAAAKAAAPEAATESAQPEPAGETVAVPPVVAFLAPAATQASPPTAAEPEETTAEQPAEEGDGAERRRRRRGRRGRGRGGRGEADAGTEEQQEQPAAGRRAADEAGQEPAAEGDEAADTDAGRDREEPESGSTRRRRHRRRRGSDGETDETRSDDPPNTVVRVREASSAEDAIQGVKGSTRLEAKRQRRRDGREQGRRRPPIITEAEFLARREAVKRVMVVRQVGERTQIAVLEDDVLVEHYVTLASSTSYAGNVYLGKVQNVLPSMEAAFVDIGKGRNAVLYAGEVNWDAAGMNGKPRKIEDALRAGQSVLVQVTKDPIAHKGARLTSQVSLPGRFLVYVPEGNMTGISRKLPDVERKRLKELLKRIVPEEAGVIIRTAAEGASEEELTRDVKRLQAQWEVISQKAAASSTSAPALLYGEPDLAIRVVRDVFNEDFSQLVVQGDEAWDTIEAYVNHVAPDLADRLSRHTGESDIFADLRIDEQLTKALDRKVWLPSGGSLVIDRTEAMTVIDVNTGKFTGQGGNLEETVTRNNLEAAEEIVRQLRLRDIGGMIVIDFIDMVLEGNRDLVLRRLTECLGRDRTKHQVAEVTSLGLVQMTRKRVGQGLLESFSETCETCNGRGVIVHADVLADAGHRNGEGSRRRPARGRGKDRSPRPEALPHAAQHEEAAQAPEPAAPAVPETVPETAAVSGAEVVAEPEDVESAAARAAGVEEAVEQSAGVIEEPEIETEVEPAPRRRTRRRAASRPPGPPVPVDASA